MLFPKRVYTTITHVLGACAACGWLAITLGASPAQAETPPTPVPVVIDTANDPHRLDDHIVVIDDPQGVLTVEQAANAPSGVQSLFGFPRPSAPAWLRFTLRNTSEQPGEFFLELAQTSYATVDLYTLGSNPGEYSIAHSGVSIPYAQRPAPGPTFVFPITVASGADATYLLRIAGGKAAQRPLQLWDQPAYAAYARQNDIVVGGIVLTLLLLALFNGLLGLVLQDRNFLLMGIFAACVAATNLGAIDLFMAALSPPQSILLIDLLQPIAAVTILVFIALVDSFLALQKWLPWAHRVSLIGIGICLLAAGLSFASSDLAILLITALGIGVTILAPLVALVVLRRGFKPARYFLLALLFPLLLNFFVNLARVGIGHWYGWYTLVTPVGGLLLILFTAPALADNVNELRRQMVRANASLRRSEERLAQYLDALPLGLVAYDRKFMPLYVNRTARRFTAQLAPSEDVSMDQFIGLNPVYVAGTGDAYPADQNPVIVALQQKDVHVENLELQAQDRRIPVEVWANPIVDEHGKVEEVVAAFQDITERRTIEAELEAYRSHLENLVTQRTAAEREQRQVAQALSETAAALTRSLDLQTVLSTILQQLQHVLDCEGAAICIIENNEAIIVDAVGIAKALAGQHNSLEHKLPGPEVIRAQRTLTLEDLQMDLAVTVEGSKIRVQSWVGVPLLYEGKPLGALEVSSAQPNAFSPAQIQLLHAFADQVAIAVANAHLYRQAQFVAIQEERQRIARDLHDAVSQTLYSATLYADVALDQVATAPDQLSKTLSRLRSLQASALAEMRSLLLELRPAALAAARLETLIAQLGDVLSTRNAVVVNLRVSGQPPADLPQETRVALYRIAQEAFNNISKHAEARQVYVTLDYGPQDLVLEITDDGCGFDPTTFSHEGLGVNIMRERASAADIAFTLTSSPGKGTSIYAAWTLYSGEEEV